MIVLRFLGRILLGAVFMFSGFVKAVDPIGFKYKIIDYLNAFGLDAVVPFALLISFIICGVELVIGLCLFFNIQTRFSSWLALLFMIAFTPLTLYLALKNPVHDCGCFGDAFKLSNWNTFYKNLIILAIAAFVFIFNKRFRSGLVSGAQFVQFLAFIVVVAGLEFYSFQFLPPLDFRPYKIGANIPQKRAKGDGETKVTYYTLVNKETNEEKKIESKTYMKTEAWKDTAWVIDKNKTYEEVLEKDDDVITDFNVFAKVIDEETGVTNEENITDKILSEQGYTFLLVAYDLNKANKKGLEKAEKLAKYCKEKGIKFYGLTATTDAKVNEIKSEFGLSFPFYMMDDIAIKTTVRANPGIMLLKEGTIYGKWHHIIMPQPEDIKKHSDLDSFAFDQQRRRMRYAVIALFSLLIIGTFFVIHTITNKRRKEDRKRIEPQTKKQNENLTKEQIILDDKISIPLDNTTENDSFVSNDLNTNYDTNTETNLNTNYDSNPTSLNTTENTTETNTNLNSSENTDLNTPKKDDTTNYPVG